MRYFKLVWSDGYSLFRHGKVSLSRGKRPGAWSEWREHLQRCLVGYHVCVKQQLPAFLACPTQQGKQWDWRDRMGYAWKRHPQLRLLLVEVEVRGRIQRYLDKYLVQQERVIKVHGRLTRRQWTELNEQKRQSSGYYTPHAEGAFRRWVKEVIDKED